jgi:signal transduction histidine kinase
MVAKFNIKTQYAAWVVTMMAVTIAVLGTLHAWRATDEQTHNTRWVAQQKALSLARLLAPELSRTNMNTMIRLVDPVGKDDEVLSLRILDAQGNVLLQPPRGQHVSRLMVVTEPVLFSDKRIGTVELGVAQPRWAQQVWASLGWDLGIGILLLALAITGSVLIAKPVLQALERLQQYIQDVARGTPHKEHLKTSLAEVDAVARELRSLMERMEDARRRLERSQKELKATQKEMDEYTYVISHDLKEPLRGMEAFSKFLSDGYRHKLDEEGQRHIDIIRKSVLRMQRLINDLLHFSRLSQQKQPMQPVGMNMMLMHVRVRLQHTLDAKQVDLRVDKLPTIVCDETAMTEVFHNLITNAVKYNDKPHPVIEVGCAEKTNPDTQQTEYEFCVRDNGVGIKKEYFDKIFQIFQRLQRDEEGTGIGLTIVRRVIEWHGGRVWLESEEGKGTTFYFTIPKREFVKTGTVLDTTNMSPKGA